MSGLPEQGGGLGDLRLHGGEVALPPEARVDGHDEHEVDQVEDVGDRSHRRGGIEGDARPGAQFGDAPEGAVQVTTGLGVDDDELAARFHEPGQQPVGLVHHEVGLERDLHQRADGGDHVRPEGQVGNEAPVHHVPLDPVHAGLLEGSHLVAEAGEVGREDGRDDADGRGIHGAGPSVSGSRFRHYGSGLAASFPREGMGPGDALIPSARPPPAGQA